jgi:D-beta-D-heptose 7-phosphate kinase/D-beta-D-heptose 1-phosphate adenosyltransferase
VLCAGDVMLDHFVYGEVSRISPEAPIPVLLTKRTESMLGGAGNAVRNLASVGAGVRFVSVIGDDDSGHQIENLCRGLAGVKLSLVREQNRSTSTKTRFIAHGQQLLRTDKESTHAIAGNTFARLTSEFRTALADVRSVLFCDYAKGVLDGSYVTELIGAAADAGCFVIVDPKGMDFRRYCGATLLKPNLREVALATAMPVETEPQQVAAARSILEITGARFVLITRGPEGMMLVGQASAPQIFPSRAREVYDVTGAGDTVAAVLSAAVSAGLDIQTAVEMANAAAGIVVGKLGTAVATSDELVASLSQPR